MYKSESKLVKNYEEMRKLLAEKEKEIRHLKDREMELSYRLNSQTCHLSYNMK